ncbi:MAG TPA: PSD1 and planctomycete cytochrome C domain-containing protein, partial [Tepidisphaeraceae bacterium]|nr:PSD1 and planctomycete cytochrome C domain-containing protein [Tepidisphaeraceae bacterium]
MRILIAMVMVGVMGVWVGNARGAEDRAGVEFFEMSIRPLLAENCYSCHGEKKQKGELRLDSRASMMRGGELGVVIVPGKPEDSLLIKAVKYTDADLQMPPKKKLSEKQIGDLVKWVRMGAVWPGEQMADKNVRPTSKPAGMVITEADRKWWAFLPIGSHGRGAHATIDGLIREKLKEKGIEQNGPASKRELIRRAYFDLWGLPPTAREVEAFMGDESLDAFEKVIDKLLASPRYGERWGRYWLDVVRYAQTNGYERDSEKPYAWRYRDYVIRAFNEDKPYDQFVRENLAGDELDKVTDDSLIATGFYRLGAWDDEPDDKRAADYDYLDDDIRTISTAFLGLTVGCARCHEHKFDPIPQADYYSLMAFLRNIRPHDAPKYSSDSGTFVPLGEREKVKQFLVEREAKIKELKGQMEAVKDKEEKKRIEGEIKDLADRKGPFEWALAIKEKGATPAKTNILLRGNASAEGPEVRAAFLTVLGGQQAAPIKMQGRESTGLRRALAEWLVGPSNPLTARVMVNRIWQHHFGRGIAATVDDFGKTGLPPTHPELLDFLAAKFMEEGWSIKKMHRMIMLSAAYRMSSRVNEKAAEIDPDNQLLWRQTMRRLEAEAIRDSVLLVSGELNEKQGGRGFFPRLSRESIAGGSRPGDGWELSLPDELNRRSIYAYVKRTMTVPMLDTFDTNNTALPSGERTVTTVAPQALMLMNDRFVHERAEGFARRIVEEVGDDPLRQVEKAYELALSRKPTERERGIAMEYVRRQASAYEALRKRLRFEPDVPSSVYSGYLKKLGAGDLLVGPRG